MNDLRGALNDYTTAITLDPKEKDAYVGRATVKKETKDYQGALADMDSAIRIDPRYAKTYTLRSEVKLLTGDVNGACDDLLTAQKLGYMAAMAPFKDHCDD